MINPKQISSEAKQYQFTLKLNLSGNLHRGLRSGMSSSVPKAKFSGLLAALKEVSVSTDSDFASSQDRFVGQTYFHSSWNGTFLRDSMSRL